MIGRLRTERRRLAALGLVVVALVLLGVGDATLSRPAPPPAAPASAVSSAAAVPGTRSTAWYCPGPLPVGPGRASAVVAVANVSSRPLAGELVAATTAGPGLAEPLDVAPGAERLVALPRRRPAAFASVKVLLDGSGAGVNETIEQPGGPLVSPCARHTSSEEFLAGGSTKGGADVDLAVYDPGSTPAVVDVTLTTPGGVVSPPDYQGLALEPGAVTVLDLSRYAIGEASLSECVFSSGGEVVAGAVDSGIVGHRLLDTLVTASPAPASSWYFAPAPSGPAARQVYTVLNPGARRATVVVRFGGPGGTSIIEAQVAPGAMSEIAPGSDPGQGSVRWAEVSSSQATPLVVARATSVLSAIGGERAAGAVAPGVPSGVLPGYALSAGEPLDAARWLLAGSAPGSAAGEFVTVGDPGRQAASFSLRRLGSGGAARRYVVEAGGSMVLDVGGGRPGSGALVLEASRPVVAGEWLYARGPGASFGLSAPGAIPVD